MPSRVDPEERRRTAEEEAAEGAGGNCHHRMWTARESKRMSRSERTPLRNERNAPAWVFVGPCWPAGLQMTDPGVRGGLDGLAFDGSARGKRKVFCAVTTTSETFVSPRLGRVLS